MSHCEKSDLLYQSNPRTFLRTSQTDRLTDKLSIPRHVTVEVNDKELLLVAITRQVVVGSSKWRFNCLFINTKRPQLKVSIY
jgi:hypothetical protein